MQKLLVLLCSIFLFVSCDKMGGGTNNSGSGEEGVAEVQTKEYKLPEVKKCNQPKTVRDLSSGMQKLFYQVNSDNVASLSLFGGAAGLKLGKKEIIVIVDFTQFKDINCEEKARYGVGVRLFLKIKKSFKGLDLNNLPHLAANVQLGKASVEYRIQTLGITGDKINALIPRSATNNFDVDGYANVVNAVDEIQALIKDGVEGVVIDPQQMPLPE